MRESIKTEMSDRFANEIMKPRIIRDYRISLDEMIYLNKAFAVMLAQESIIEKSSAGKIVDGIDFVHKNLKEEDLSGKLEDFYFNVERSMFNKIGADVGGKLHTGRSRNDIAATLTRMEIRKTVWDVVGDLIDFQKLLLERAIENTETVITGYTHCQPGQPTTLAHYYMAVFYSLNRDFGRIKHAYENLNISPYGAAAFAGASFPINRKSLADLLGFDSIMENTFDCIASKDYIQELCSAYTTAAVTLSRVAEDMYFWATYENGILEIGGEIAICSSIMPQKRNPVSLEYTRALAGEMIGSLVALFATLKGIPFTNNMDIHETPGAYMQNMEQIREALCCIHETVLYSSIRKDLAIKKASENLSTVTSLADYMVKNHGLSFTQAHDIVGNVAAIVTENRTFSKGITADMVMEQAKQLGTPIEMTQKELDSVLEPFNNVSSKTGVGGPSVSSVKTMIDNAKNYLEVEKKWLTDVKGKVDQSYARIEKECDKLPRK